MTHHKRFCQLQESGHAIRGHFGFENSLYWVWDVVYLEDESRAPIGNTKENLAVLGRIALNLLRQEKTSNVGGKAKRLKPAGVRNTCSTSSPLNMRSPCDRPLMIWGFAVNFHRSVIIGMEHYSNVLIPE